MQGRSLFFLINPVIKKKGIFYTESHGNVSRPTSHDFTALHEAISASRDHCVLVTIKPAHSRKLGRVQTRCRQRRRQRPLKTNSSRRRLSLFDSLFWGGFPYTTFRVFSCFNALKTYLNSLSLHSYVQCMYGCPLFQKVL